MSECREVADGLLGRQTLQVRRGNCDPLMVMEVRANTTLPDLIGGCRIFGRNRVGHASTVAGAFHRLGVSPDGSGVVFELTADFSILPLIAYSAVVR
jgi:hypothetical protein